MARLTTRKQKVIKILSAVGVLSCLIYVALVDISYRPNNGVPIQISLPAGFDQHQPRPQMVQNFEAIIPEKYNEAVVKTRMISEKIKRLSGMVIHSDETIPGSNRTDLPINYNVHIFYHCPVNWWLPGERGRNHTEENLNIVFYPELGIYNCSEPTVAKHFELMNRTRIGVVLFSWSENGTSSEVMNVILEQAEKFQLRVSFVLEDFQGRTVQRIRNQIEFISGKYSKYESFNRIYDKERQGYYPVFYIKDTINSGITEANWRDLLDNKHSTSIRGTPLDAILINHIVNKDDLASTKRSGFDGFFTYSAINGETFASTWKNWKQISRFAAQYKMLFIPAVGPGHVEKIWKGESDHKQKHHAIRHRGNGNYYGVGWRTAIQLENDPFISISSFNNWVQGTQIEPAVQRWSYRDYANKHANYSTTKYLDLTRYWIGEFTDRKTADEDNLHFCQAPKNATVDTEKGPRHLFVKGLKQHVKL